ncbi:MAG: HNH endonuclease [Pseudobutyrivibrio sp.]|nr:HNH endonuclease [Pseudobutyrivibrio sp.]
MGYAYLADGTRMDYKDYIQKAPYWQKVRQARFEFDNGQCAICHCDLHDKPFETHHLTYIHLGHEHLTDVITLCPKHHTIFHNNWAKQEFWKGKEKGHWTVFDIEHTAEMCLAYYRDDKFICKAIDAPNLCNREIQREYLDRYFADYEILNGVLIDPNDFGLFVRNKRYELFFEAEKRGLTVEQFLDEYYGVKERGKNPIRAEAGKKNGPFDHDPKSFHYHYSENPNINRLMELTQSIEKEK